MIKISYNKEGKPVSYKKFRINVKKEEGKILPYRIDGNDSFYPSKDTMQEMVDKEMERLEKVGVFDNSLNDPYKKDGKESRYANKSLEHRSEPVYGFFDKNKDLENSLIRSKKVEEIKRKTKRFRFLEKTCLIGAVASLIIGLYSLFSIDKDVISKKGIKNYSISTKYSENINWGIKAIVGFGGCLAGIGGASLSVSLKNKYKEELK